MSVGTCWARGGGRGADLLSFLLAGPHTLMRKAASSHHHHQLHTFGSERLRTLLREILEPSLMTTKKSGVAFPRFQG